MLRRSAPLCSGGDENLGVQSDSVTEILESTELSIACWRNRSVLCCHLVLLCLMVMLCVSTRDGLSSPTSVLSPSLVVALSLPNF